MSPRFDALGHREWPGQASFRITDCGGDDGQPSMADSRLGTKRKAPLSARVDAVTLTL